MKQALRGVGETLRCSVGLAPNRYLAKLASDMMMTCPRICARWNVNVAQPFAWPSYLASTSVRWL
jgi:nucleotidyltransferase/DNA polymerase involved in DNA repair